MEIVLRNFRPFVATVTCIAIAPLLGLCSPLWRNAAIHSRVCSNRRINIGSDGISALNPCDSS